MAQSYRQPIGVASSSHAPPAPPVPRRPIPLTNLSEGFAGMSIDTPPNQGVTSTYYTGGQAYRPPLPVRPPTHPQVAGPPPLPPPLPLQRPSNIISPEPSGHGYGGSTPLSQEETPPPIRDPMAALPISRPEFNPPISVSDPPRPPLKSCPNDYPIHFATRWYKLPGLPSLLVCSKCYTSYILPSPFASHFHAIDEPAGEARMCRFNTPRLLQIWRQAVASNTFSTVQSYMEARANIPSCPKSSGTSTKWFVSRSSDIPNLKACEACLLDVIHSTNFADNFCVIEQQSTGRPWICSLSLPFISRAIQAYSPTRAWTDFAAAATQRLSMPACPEKQSVVSATRKWLRPKVQIPGLVICETCYFDSAACSSMALEFEYTRGDYISQWTCDMALLPLKAVWSDAFLADNFGMWWDAARAAFASPNCASGKIVDGMWYTLLHEPEGFDLCPACYAAFINIYSIKSCFKTRRYAPGTAKMCSFNTQTKRFRGYMLKLNEAVETYRNDIFTDYVHRFSCLEPCPGNDALQNARWYGTTEYLFCPECYETYAKNTNIASRFTEVNALLQPGYICSLASPRMRRLWAEACAKNDDLQFGEIAKQRVQVWIQTLGEAKNIVALTRMRLQQKGTLALAGVMITGGGNIAAAASGHHHHNYGNSSIGWGFDNSAQAQGAILNQQSNSISVVGAGDYVRVAQLEALWKEVE